MKKIRAKVNGKCSINQSTPDRKASAPDRDPEGQEPPTADEQDVWPTFSPKPLAAGKKLNLGLLASGLIFLALGFFLGQFSQSNRRGLPDLERLLANQTDNQLEPQKPDAGSILPVETIRAERVDSTQLSRTFTGSVVARYTSQLGFERSGQVVRLSVDEGEQVAVGTPLATLDTSNLKAQQQQLLAQRAQAIAKLEEMQAGPRSETIAAARAAVRNLRSQLELARKKRARREALYRQGAISREQLDEAASETSVLQARLDEAQSQLDELLAGTRPELIEAQEAAIAQLNASLADLQIELEKSILKAPFTGTVSARNVDEGTVISPGQSVFDLVSNRVEARVGIPVTAAEQIQLHSTLPIKIGEKTYQGRVSSILPVLDLQTRTLTVVLTLDESVGSVAPGQVARLSLVKQIPTAGYWLPISALVQGERGLWSCYVLGKPAPGENLFAIQRREVEILQTQNDRVLVRGTLQPEDQVIVNGTHRLVPGQLVRPVEKLP